MDRGAWWAIVCRVTQGHDEGTLHTCLLRLKELSLIAFSVFTSLSFSGSVLFTVSNLMAKKGKKIVCVFVCVCVFSGDWQKERRRKDLVMPTM